MAHVHRCIRPAAGHGAWTCTARDIRWRTGRECNDTNQTRDNIARQRFKNDREWLSGQPHSEPATHSGHTNRRHRIEDLQSVGDELQHEPNGKRRVRELIEVTGYDFTTQAFL